MLQAYVWASVAVGDLRSTLRSRLTELTRNEDGGVAAEYALLVSLIAIVLVAGAFWLGTQINARLLDTGDCIAAAPAGTC